jgi:putative FmdB family regulatory protein
MPLYEYLCDSCGHQFEEFLNSRDKYRECPHCESSAEVLPALHGGYRIKGDNSASVRPKQAGSFKKSKD